MNIEQIKAAVDAARERQRQALLGVDDSNSGFENWLIENLKQSDTALIALWETFLEDLKRDSFEDQEDNHD